MYFMCVYILLLLVTDGMVIVKIGTWRYPSLKYYNWLNTSSFLTNITSLSGYIILFDRRNARILDNRGINGIEGIVSSQ